MRFIVGVKFYMEVSSETSDRGGGVIMQIGVGCDYVDRCGVSYVDRWYIRIIIAIVKHRWRSKLKGAVAS